MDSRTAEYYTSRVKDATELYNSANTGGAGRYFASSFPAGSSVLDIGCGSGRDMALLKSQGYDVYGIDQSPEMAAGAAGSYPELKDRVKTASLPAEGRYFNMTFDCILCSAVLMHITYDRIFDAAFTIRNNLKENGRLLISIPVQRPDVGDDSRVPDGRLFIIRPPDYYTLLFERLGFRKTGYFEEEDSLGREGVKWGVVVFNLESDTGSRSIDKIESILNRDKKTATYKLALFRAFTDIASTGYNTVHWYNNSTVGIPVRSIAEKWLLYYWPIFESGMFIPQINGESPGCGKPVKFRKSLTEVIEKNRLTGGLNGFYNNYINDAAGNNKITEKLFREIEDTIIKGPVYFTGGSLDEGRIFSFNPRDRNVIIPSAIWKEFCLMWHWIGDALILRWGELTYRMSNKEIAVSEVIGLLVNKTDTERETAVSRNIFSGERSLECVWTGVPVKNRYDIDHVIPYSLWHNNDLWNLLPAHPKVNNNKRDLLPTRQLMNKRKDVIKDYWDIISKKYPARFGNETVRFKGTSASLSNRNSNWHEELFSAVVEAVEITAIQRGVGRWGG